MVILPPEKQTACSWFPNHLAGRRKTSGHWQICSWKSKHGAAIEKRQGEKDEELYPPSRKEMLLDWQDFL